MRLDGGFYMWLTKLQIAIIEKDIDSIDKLVSDMPHFKNVTDMKSASSLIREALKLLSSMKDDTQQILTSLKKHKDFLDVSYIDEMKTQRLDVTS